MAIAAACAFVAVGIDAVQSFAFGDGPAPFAIALPLALLPVPLLISLVLWMDRLEPEPGRISRSRSSGARNRGADGADHQHRRPGVRDDARARCEHRRVRGGDVRRTGGRGDDEGPGALRPAVAQARRDRRADRRGDLRVYGRPRVRDGRERRLLHQRDRDPRTRRHRAARLHLRAQGCGLAAAAPHLHLDDRPRRRLCGVPAARRRQRQVGGLPRLAGRGGAARHLERAVAVRHRGPESAGT